jgi:hypothetical protein
VKTSYDILILGASYGSLLATKLLIARHNATLVCLPKEVEAINAKGARVRLPVKGRSAPIEIDSRYLPGKLVVVGPNVVDPAKFDLVALAMQEPQYRSNGVRELLHATADARVPCMSIMNMPPLPYLERIPGLSIDALESCYTDASVWHRFDPAAMTLCSPDPQAFRPSEEDVNVLQVTLPTNFKAARFPSDEATAMLRRMERDIDAIRYDAGDGKIELPVKLRVHESVFVPLAKWAMLITGNYRCVLKDEARSIRDAVFSDLAQSRSIYDWVLDVCVRLGAAAADLVPFEKYAAAAETLARPSSAARALFAGAPNIERVDRLVQAAAAQKGMRFPALDATVALIDARLANNRRSLA